LDGVKDMSNTPAQLENPSGKADWRYMRRLWSFFTARRTLANRYRFPARP